MEVRRPDGASLAWGRVVFQFSERKPSISPFGVQNETGPFLRGPPENCPGKRSLGERKGFEGEEEEPFKSNARN
jgi:hypothetical protein